MAYLDKARVGETTYDLQDTKAQAMVAPAYSSSATYAAGDYVTHEGALYRCKQAVSTAEAWTAAHWEQVTAGGEAAALSRSVALDKAFIYRSEEIALSAATYKTGQITDSGKWTTGSGQTYFIPVDSCAVSVSVTAAPGQAARAALLTNDTITNGAVPDYAGSTTVANISAGGTQAFDIPAGCKYLGIRKKTSTTDTTPQSVVFTLRNESVGCYAQEFTDAKKAVARENIGAAEEADVFAFSDVPVYPYMAQKLAMNPSSGQSTGSSTKRLVTNFLYLHKGSRVAVDPETAMGFQVYSYDRTRAYIAANYLAARKAYTAVCDGWYRFVMGWDSDGAISASDIPVMAAALSVRDRRDPGVLPRTLRFVLPELVPVAGGRQMDIYYQNVVYGYNTSKAARIIADSNAFANREGFARWEPAGSDTSAAAQNFIDLFAHSTTEFDAAAGFGIVRVGTNAGNGLSKKVMIIGDSITGGYSTVRTELVSLFADDPMSITLVGTRHEDPYHSEARSSWGFCSYWGDASKTVDGQTVVNPFYNSTVEHFDFGYYMTENGDAVPVPDYALLCLGTNDVSRTDAEILEAAEGIAGSIKDYNSAIRVGVWLPPIPATLNKASDGAGRIYQVLQLLIKTFSGRASEGIHTIPVYLAVDTKHDYRTAEENISARNSSYRVEVVTTEGSLHPSVAGLEKIADVLYSFIKYLGYLDA